MHAVDDASGPGLRVVGRTEYAQRKMEKPSAEDVEIMNRIDAQYTAIPCYGSRRMTAHLRAMGVVINRKRVQRLVRQMGLAGMAPGPNTSKPQQEHQVYPYLLRGLVIGRPGQVWSTDATYIRLKNGFVYLVAVMDWYSRKVLS